MTKVTAHAGCEGTPKGSRESVEMALYCGADAVEMDLRLLDGEVYLSHDIITAEAPDACLTFRQALELLRPSGVELNCDLKEIPVLPEALRILREMGMERRAFFTGETGTPGSLPEQDCRCFFNIERLSFLENSGRVAEEEAERLIKLYRARRYPALAGFNVEYTTLTAEAIQMFSEEEVPLSCWLVNDEEAIDAFMRAGVAYLTTDRVGYAAVRRGKRAVSKRPLSV